MQVGLYEVGVQDPISINSNQVSAASRHLSVGTWDVICCTEPFSVECGRNAGTYTVDAEGSIQIPKHKHLVPFEILQGI